MLLRRGDLRRRLVGLVDLVARCAELPEASASGDTPEDARAALKVILRCRAEGRNPTAREMLEATA